MAPLEEPTIDTRRVRLKVCFTLQEYEEAKQGEAKGWELIFLDDPEFDAKDADLVLPVGPRIGRWGRVIR